MDGLIFAKGEKKKESEREREREREMTSTLILTPTLRQDRWNSLKIGDGHSMSGHENIVSPQIKDMVKERRTTANTSRTISQVVISAETANISCK